MKNYLFNILVAGDRLLNALIRGNPGETLSSVAYRKHRDGKPFKFTFGLINWLFRNPSHCENAYYTDRHPVLAE